MIDLLTVTYGKELSLLRLQANSIRLFIDRELINKIHIVNNDDVDISFVSEWYGDLADKLEFSHYSDHDPNIIPHIYSSHQILKCLYALRSTRYYMILDTKNFFVKPVTKDHLFKDGLPIASLYGKQGFDRRPWERDMWANICQFFHTQIDVPLLYSTPFIVDKHIMLSMIERIESQTDMSLAEYFLTQSMLEQDKHVYEFFLYSGIINDYETVHKIVDRFVSSVWPSTINMRHCQPDYIHRDHRLFATGIHRTAWNMVGEAWSSYLEELGLLDKDSFRQIQADML